MAEFLLSAFADEASPMIEGQIVALKRNGVKFIEVRNANGKSIIDHDKNSLKEIKKQFDAGGISVSSIGSPIGKIAVNQGFEPHIEAFKRTIETAQILETNRIRMFSFFIPHGADPASFRLEVMERMNSLLDIADGTGVMCCHENEKDIYGDIRSVHSICIKPSEAGSRGFLTLQTIYSAKRYRLLFLMNCSLILIICI